MQRASTFGDKLAIIDAASGRTITYAQLPGRIGAAVAGLRARGITRDSTVCIMLTNCLEYCIAFNAIAAIGAVVRARGVR